MTGSREAFLAYADAREAAAQGVDPLTHYLTVGWKKGHDPSVQFDGAKYLAFYSDVAGAGMSVDSGNDWWYADFEAPMGEILVPGRTYTGATRHPLRTYRR